MKLYTSHIAKGSGPGRQDIDTPDPQVRGQVLSLQTATQGPMFLPFCASASPQDTDFSGDSGGAL